MRKSVALIGSLILALIAIVCVIAVPSLMDVSLRATENGSITFVDRSGISHPITDANAADGEATSYNVGEGTISYNVQTNEIVMNNVVGQRIQFDLNNNFTVTLQGTNTLSGGSGIAFYSTKASATMTVEGTDSDILNASYSGNAAVYSEGALIIKGGKITASSEGDTVGGVASLQVLGGEVVSTANTGSALYSGGGVAVSSDSKLAVYGLGSGDSAAVKVSFGDFTVRDTAKVYVYHESDRGIQLSSGRLNVSGGQLEVYSAAGIPVGGASSYSFTGGVVLFHAPNGAFLDNADATATVENAYFVGNTGLRSFTTPATSAEAYDRTWSDVNNPVWMYWAENATYQYYNNKAENYPGVLVTKAEQYVFTAPVATDHIENLVVGQCVFDGETEVLRKGQTKSFAAIPVIAYSDGADEFASVTLDFNGEYGLNFEYVEQEDSEGQWLVVGNNESPAVVSVLNEGDMKLLVDVRYAKNEAAASYGDFNVSWAATLGGVPAAEHSSGDGYVLAKRQTLNFTLNVTGKPQQEMTDVVAGTLTVYLSTFMEYDESIDHTILAANSINGLVEVYDLDKILALLPNASLQSDGSYLIKTEFQTLRERTYYTTSYGNLSGIDTSLTAAKRRNVKNNTWASGDGRDIIVTTSSDNRGDICVFFVDGNNSITATYKFWAIRQAWDQPHDLEILPNGDLIIATTSSGNYQNGKYLAYIPLSQWSEANFPTYTETTYTNALTDWKYGGTTLSLTDTVDGAHGVTYVPDENGGYLWVLQDEHIRKVNIVGYGTAKPTLEYAKDGSGNYVQCALSDGFAGHALTPVLGSDGLFVVTGVKDAWIFDSEKMECKRMDDVYQCGSNGSNCGTENSTNGNVKGMVYFEDGTAVMLPGGYNAPSNGNQSAGFHVVIWQNNEPIHIKVQDTGSPKSGFYKIFPYSADYR